MTAEDRLPASAARISATEDQSAIMRLMATYGPAVDCGENRTTAELWADSGVYDVGDVARAVGHSIVFRRGDNVYGAWRVSANRWTLSRTRSGWRITEPFNLMLDPLPESHETLRAAVR
jgi:SnoaL-like domain